MKKQLFNCKTLLILIRESFRIWVVFKNKKTTNWRWLFFKDYMLVSKTFGEIFEMRISINPAIHLHYYYKAFYILSQSLDIVLQGIFWSKYGFCSIERLFSMDWIEAIHVFLCLWAIAYKTIAPAPMVSRRGRPGWSILLDRTCYLGGRCQYKKW